MSSLEPEENVSSPLALFHSADSHSNSFPDHTLSMMYGFGETTSSSTDGAPQFEVVVEESTSLFDFCPLLPFLRLRISSI